MNARFEQLKKLVESRSLTVPGAADSYDVVVIGAGPAGAVAARAVASKGLTVLLVDKSVFPRHKVCGCCLSAQALQTLRHCGLGELPAALGAQPLIQLRAGVGGSGGELTLPLLESFSLSRSRFDLGLIGAAIESGVFFMPDTTAQLPVCPYCSSTAGCLPRGAGRTGGSSNSSPESVVVALESSIAARDVHAKVAVVADGIGATSISKHHCMQAVVSLRARVGTGAISAQAPSFYEPGTIYMACGAAGYLGVVRLEDGTANIAAAFDPEFLRECTNAGAAAHRLFDACGWPAPTDVMTLRWKGTVPLTRKRPVLAGHRVFVIGDAAGFIEPCIGEGMGSALRSAQAVAPLVVGGATRWDASLTWRWEHTYRRTIRRSQQITKVVAVLLRHPELVRAASRVLGSVPALKHHLVHLVSSPRTKGKQP